MILFIFFLVHALHKREGVGGGGMNAVNGRALLGALCVVVSLFAFVGCSGSLSIIGDPQNFDVRVPQDVTVTSGSTELTVSWSSEVNATSYNVYWGLSSGVTTTTGTKIEGVTSPFTQTGLKNATPIYYVVTASDESGESDPSAEVSSTPEFQGGVETSFSIIEDSAMRTTIKLASDDNGNIYFLLPAYYGRGISKIFKFNESGQQVAEFGNGGSIEYSAEDPTDSCFALGIDTDSTGNLYVAGLCGYERPVYYYQARIWKYTPDGAPDTSFGNGNGYIDSNIAGPPNGIWVAAQDIFVASDNNIIVAASTTMALGNKMLLFRISSTGEFLSSAEQPMNYPAPLTFVKADDAGNIYVVGMFDGGEGVEAPPWVWKFLSDGTTLDTGFNSTGIYELTGYIHTGPPSPDSNGNVYLIGTTSSGGDNNPLWSIKLDSSGSPVASFGNNGAVNLTEVCGAASAPVFLMLSVSTLEPGGNIIATGLSTPDGVVLKNAACAVNGTTGLVNPELFTNGISTEAANLFGLFATVDNLGRVLTANMVTADFQTIQGYQILRYK